MEYERLLVAVKRNFGEIVEISPRLFAKMEKGILFSEINMFCGFIFWKYLGCRKDDEIS